jgi:hypothetical protein
VRLNGRFKSCDSFHIRASRDPLIASHNDWAVSIEHPIRAMKPESLSSEKNQSFT